MPDLIKGGYALSRNLQNTCSVPCELCDQKRRSLGPQDDLNMRIDALQIGRLYVAGATNGAGVTHQWTWGCEGHRLLRIHDTQAEAALVRWLRMSFIQRLRSQDPSTPLEGDELTNYLHEGEVLPRNVIVSTITLNDDVSVSLKLAPATPKP